MSLMGANSCFVLCSRFNSNIKKLVFSSDVIMAVASSSVTAALGEDAPPNGLPFWNLASELGTTYIGVFLKSVENIPVDNQASEIRLIRIRKAINTDISPTDGANLVFNLASLFPNDGGVKLLKRVLSLGARPDVGNFRGQLPLEEALQQSKLPTAAALFMCRHEVFVRQHLIIPLPGFVR